MTFKYICKDFNYINASVAYSHPLVMLFHFINFRVQTKESPESGQKSCRILSGNWLFINSEIEIH